ncbi:methyltransferase domain-containing protein [Microcoleus sp. FACHB-1515]|uniref:methyltransferase domain-containing protein n=2 Tax=Cyanophyceae TaxID=3028117 RepID=UPI001A7E3C97|nr:methyltransferase domain-containing protein [Microcoleus sp. FACHB-1515]
MMTREEKILSAIDPATQIGLEIGPLNRPIITRQMGEIRYVDHASTKELKQKYAQDPNVDISQIVDVDYIWGEKSLPELVGNEAPFDYVIASHVIEHVPDFIGWLKEIHSVLKPDGVLSLVIPDKRCCFDYLREPTQSAEVVEAYLQGNRKPSSRQIFEFFSKVVSWKGQFNWNPNDVVKEDEVVRLHSEAQAWATTHQVFKDGSYYDVHCWVFTPYSFFELVKSLIEIDLFDFKVMNYSKTTGCEFYVSLQKIDSKKGLEEQHQIKLKSLPLVEPELNLLPTPATLNHAQSTLPQIAEAQSEVKHSGSVEPSAEEYRKTTQQLRARIKRLKGKLEQAESEIAAMKTSKFWQLRTQWIRLKRSIGLKDVPG